MAEMFVWGLIIGYITGCISGVIIEVFCVIASQSDERGDDNVMKK